MALGGVGVTSRASRGGIHLSLFPYDRERVLTIHFYHSQILENIRISPETHG